MSDSSPARHAFRVAFIYALAGCGWILFSDRLLAALTEDPAVLSMLQTAKGWGFVVLSGVLLFVLVRSTMTGRQAVDQAMRQSEARFRATFRGAAIGLAHVDLQGRWLMVNSSLCEMVGYGEAQLLARDFQSITHPDDLSADLDHVKALLDGHGNSYSMEKRYIRSDGTVFWILLTVALVRDDSGEPAYFIVAVQDIDQRKRAEDEREVMLAEIHHRVRNNLQLVVSMLLMERNKFADAQVRASFDELLSRVQAMGLVHNQLYESGNFAEVDLGGYLHDLGEALAKSCGSPIHHLYLLDEVRVDMARAVPLGLLVVELLSNAHKHAFPCGRRGTIRISLSRDEDRLTVTVGDNGIGLPAEGCRPSTGLTLVNMLCDQLGGTLTQHQGTDGGAVFRVDVAG